MTLLALGSVTGSPGVTRLAIGLAGVWPGGRRRVVVEADPDGGRLGAELGVGVEPGLMALAVASRTRSLRGDEVVTTGAAAVGPWFVVPAPPSGEQATSALLHAGASLAEVMRVEDDHLWLVDTGRLSTRSPALSFARLADRTVLVTAGSFPALQLVANRVAALQQAGCDVGVVVVQPSAWGVSEVADFVGADVLAVLPQVRQGRRDDVRSMRGTGWRAWWRAVEELARDLADRSSPPFGASDGASPGGDAVPSAPGWPR